ncbi:MAG: hypothetical protein ABI700_03855 [Chloroflexota bacterium]
MSEESQSHNFGPVRPMSPSEKILLRKLLELKQGGGDNYAIDSLQVQEMLDSGVGSLYFYSQRTTEQRSFGKRIGEIEFMDVDEVKVIVSLNVDDQGDLYELDIWRVDFEPVKQWPT